MYVSNIDGGVARVQVDVPESELELLDRVAKCRAISRAELIRQAIRASLAQYRKKRDHAVFGAWSDAKEDGLAYQERMREEW